MEKSSRRNLLDLLMLKKESAPFFFCQNPEHGKKKEWALVLKSFPINLRGENWVTLVYLHFWVDEASMEKIKEDALGHEELMVRVQGIMNEAIASHIEGYEGSYDVTCEICFSTVGASNVEGLRLTEPKLGETMICPRCGQKGKYARLKRGDALYGAIMHRTEERTWVHFLKALVLAKEKEKCPKCGLFGRVYIDTRGYRYFSHSVKGKRTKCYLGRE